jgi:fatty-acyl-CoA synthase
MTCFGNCAFTLYQGIHGNAGAKLKRGTMLAEQDVKNFCKGQIANYKIPRYVRFVDSFPMTGSGKMQKFRMREISLAELSANKAAAAFASA